MSRPRPLQRERGNSFFREELVEENVSILVDRFLAGISSCYSNSVTQIQLRQIVEALNALVKNISVNRATNSEAFECDPRVLQGLHLGLLSPSTSLRAGSARALRYTTTSLREFAVLLSLNTNIPISRCVDTVSQSSPDYFQVIRLISSLFRLATSQCPGRNVTDFFCIIISSCCSAILHEGAASQWQQSHPKSPKQQLVIPRKLTAEIISEACLTASAPLCQPFPQMLHSLMTVALSESFYLSINEAIVGVFVHLLNYPHTRRAFYSSGCLESLIAKFADDTVSPETPSAQNQQQQQQINDEKAPTFQWRAAQFTLTKLFHSCPGAFALLGGNYCRELLNGLAPPMGFEPGADDGGFFITSRVSAKRIKRQRELLALLAAIFNIETPQWTTDVSSAILSADPRKFEESWNVSEGFVAAEAEDLLYFSVPRRFIYSNPPPDPVSTLMALILSGFVEAHLVSALATFSMSCLQYSFRGTKPSQKGGVIQLDPHFTEVECLGIQAVVILAHVLHQVSRLLLNNSCSASDELERCIAAFHNNLVTSERQDVVQTIFDVITQTHALLSAAENQPSSLHLELILRYCPKQTNGQSGSLIWPPLQMVDARPRSQSSSFTKQLLDGTGLLVGVPTMESVTWPSIRLLLDLSPLEVRRAVSEGDLITAFRNLAAFYKSTGTFCHTDISSALRGAEGRIQMISPTNKPKSRLPDIVHCAISLIDFLLAGSDIPLSDSLPQSASLGTTSVRADYYKIAGDLISDICRTLNSVVTNPQCTAGENGAGYISIGSLPRVGAQFWFAILGACTSSNYRQTLLQEHRSGAFDVLRLFLNNSQSTEVMRLALSFLNFAVSEPSRQLLAEALESPEDELRLYALHLVTGLWLRIDNPFSFAKWAVPLITPLIGDSQWRVADTTVMALLEIIPICPFAGSIIRSLKPPFRLNETPHRLLYGCSLVSPGVWQAQNTKEAVVKELDFYVKGNFNHSYSTHCDMIFLESFSGCFSRQPGCVEHYSNVRSNKRLRLPGRHFPPTIFTILSRTQMGIHFLSKKVTNYVRNCCETLSYYANPHLLSESPKYCSETVASIRSAMCTIANIGCNPLGADWLATNSAFKGFNTIADFYALAQNSPVFSIRATAIMVLSVVGDSVDPDLLVNCQWADRRRHTTLVPCSSIPLVPTNSNPLKTPPSSRRPTFSIPDISIEPAEPPVDQPNSSLLNNSEAIKRRASTTDAPITFFEPSSLSSSSSSSETSIANGGLVELNTPGNRTSMPVHHAPLAARPSLPAMMLRVRSTNDLQSMRTPPPSPRQKSGFSSKISNIFRRGSSRSKPPRSPTVGYDQGHETTFFPEETSSTEATSQTREKSLSVDFGNPLGSLEAPSSANESTLGFLTTQTNGSPKAIINIFEGNGEFGEVKIQRSSSCRTQNGDNECRREQMTFCPPTAESLDLNLASSIFYLPMEEMSDFGRVTAGVFLPKDISELLQDAMTTVHGFKRNPSQCSPMPHRKMSLISTPGTTGSQSGNIRAGTNEAQQLFPPGEASNIISEHTAQCIICCLNNSNQAARAPIVDEWQQVLWLVVSLQIWPNRTPKMLLSYLANNKHLASDGCLYSEVVTLMSRIALPRSSRQFVHSLFDTLSFAPLAAAARELNPSVV